MNQIMSCKNCQKYIGAINEEHFLYCSFECKIQHAADIKVRLFKSMETHELYRNSKRKQDKDVEKNIDDSEK